MPTKRSTLAWAAAGIAAAAVLALALWPASGGETTAAGAAAAAPQAAQAAATAPGPGGPAIPPPAGERQERLRLLTEQVRHADHTWCSYAASTVYPLASRPIAEHPDQVHPNRPVVETNPMRFEGGRGTDPKVLVQTSQSRVFMVAGEAAAFSLRAIDPQGAALPVVITSAVARGVTFGASRPAAQVTLQFADDGLGADPAAGDSHFAAVLAPAQTGLAQFNGTIRTEVRYSAAGRTGVVLFDVIYSPEVPATWAGAPREIIEDGSLVYVLKADVRQAGRYIVSGRVDDANGKPFALATFNDVLRAGPGEVRLTVFGKLLHDKAPAMPLVLRDVEGYLLKEDTDPDRALMPRLEGRVVAGKPHAPKSFSDAEWNGEERTRHLAEFAKDVALARKALADFDPSVPQPPSQCAPGAVK
ncbi:choice-of-anchor X domain-containing protein [Massilia cavernae]|uniref:Uncharacterized protein n=1 Tax=Massilia cavernae TaxID=2320864 RepID=A0A418XRI3_9BURK|nr:choice-of-anchor X domain-containing protein [Massilia cavernae]RJG15103.1 hypothetical protein D3872_14570 [Massilia cavernae]